MNRRIYCLLWLLLTMLMVHADLYHTPEKIKNPAGHFYFYRFTLRDKLGGCYSLQKPWQFLSQKSLSRRNRQQLPLDSTDLPVSDRYIQQFLDIPNAQLIGTSRWNNTILMRMSDTLIAKRLSLLPCVVRYRCVGISPDSITPTVRAPKVHTTFNSWDSVPNNRYGTAADQILIHDGITLHDHGYKGNGITIAILDGGFMNVNRIPMFRDTHILGTHDFVFPPSPNIYDETDHGTKVLSTMAAYVPYVYIGTAPEANYWLIRCEDQQSEQMVEEDYWAMAAEFADSVGVDIISSSLGYEEFDDHATTHQYWEMDGHTTLISNTASMLAFKGIAGITSAGNSGMGPWKKITFPADADNVLTVGAVTSDKTNAPFCGVGPTQDGRIKPDVMALGSPSAVITGRGTVAQDIGTSFSTPIIAGLVACLWQSQPQLTALQLIQLVRNSSNNVAHPNNIYGYGIPDFWKASQWKH